MSEADRVEQMRRDADAAGRAADELEFNVTDRSIGSSSSSDPDSAIRITKPDADLFGNRR
jgi:hypothetical protein